MKHHIFFDSNCPLCQRSVKKIQEMDKQGVFEFYPLTSEKAHEELPKELLKGDTLVLKETSGKVWVRAKAVVRILTLVGKKGLSWLLYVPGLDLFYRFIAKNRHFF